jgi:hypothetical protein
MTSLGYSNGSPCGGMILRTAFQSRFPKNTLLSDITSRTYRMRASFKEGI